MKRFSISLTRSFGLAAIAAALLAFQPGVQAAPKHHKGGGHHSAPTHHRATHHSTHRAPSHRHVTHAAPRHHHHHDGYRLIYGDGYRGPGYYYGPPGLGYYGPGVTFYSSLGDAPASLRVTIR